MMSFAGFGNGSWILFCLHFLFFAVAAFGVLTALIMFAKSKNEKMMKKVMLITLVVGVVGLLITAPFAHRLFSHNLNFRYRMEPMMFLDREDKLSDSEKGEYLNKMRERMDKILEEKEAELTEESSELNE